jgi:hypothetical protein
MAFTEGVLGYEGNADRVKGGLALGGDLRIGEAGATNARPSEWLAWRGPGGHFADGRNFYRGNAAGEFFVPGDHLTFPAGSMWADGTPVRTGVFTILPPNSVSIAAGSADDWPIPAASSYHPGGVNASICDGAVRFVSDTVNTGDLSIRFRDLQSNRPQDFGGPSPYGVWGAFGTAAGGESMGLP